MIRLIAGCFALLLLAGCASGLNGRQGALPLGQVENPVAGTELAGPGTFLGQLPVAIVVLKPDAYTGSVDTPRNRDFCAAFQRMPAAAALQAANVIAPNIILTRWPLTVGSATPEQAHDCGFLLANYATPRVGTLVRNIQSTRGSFEGQGPYFVVIDGSAVTAADGSGTSDFDRFIANWGRTLAAADQGLATQASTRGTPTLLQRAAGFLVQILTTFYPPAAIVVGFIKEAVCTSG